MAAGRPILASDIPGNRWLVDDTNGIGSGALLFRPGDGEDFVRKALRLANDAALRDFYAANSRLRAAAWPQPGEEARALLRIYEAAIGRP
jgi:glycosyltransferase involved in cell wall biosynthesis